MATNNLSTPNPSIRNARRRAAFIGRLLGTTALVSTMLVPPALADPQRGEAVDPGSSDNNAGHHSGNTSGKGDGGPSLGKAMQDGLSNMSDSGPGAKPGLSPGSKKQGQCGSCDNDGRD